MRVLLILPMLILAACSVINTPEERYYAANNGVVVVLRAVDSFVKDCKLQVPTDPCYAKFPAINKSVKVLKTAVAQGDKVFVTKDETYYDIAITTVESAVAQLRNILSQESI